MAKKTAAGGTARARRMKQLLIPEEKILKHIVIVRNQRVLLDVHLAELYGIQTRVLKQAVRRNLDRFPDDFMIELSDADMDLLVSQNVILDRKQLGGSAPFAFTEAGVAMLSSVLKSEKAIGTNIAIMRAFVALRKMAINYHDILDILRSMRTEYDTKFDQIFDSLEQLIRPPQATRTLIGFEIPGSQRV
ncbi:ORF6N domain-containing protein [Chitinophaga niabensis]|uniref:ORF6N domain-containing protein n=1 Tax=Chitinophaga niabensis TaxID=536979 RepID=A0A1N6EY54_9BACT|nr:ORF6N domain-containing protein [Chitinophaga niabensis]SIN87901.1 ORF6N domain-containing protein [Chitinophaga niabensis]